MPRDKDLKRLVRTRMKKTGESYTAARARIVSKTPKSSPHGAASAAAESPASRPEYAKIAGMSDEKVKEKTGCDWERWVYALDRRGAAAMAHRDIALLVHEKYKVDGWWAQMVTVGYERIKGLRDRGQRRGGGYEAGKSRTFHVSVGELYEACALAKLRRRWITDADPKVRTARKPKSIRLGLEDGTIAALWFIPKGDSKSTVTVQHLKLPDKDAAERSKQVWGERLDALTEVLKNR
jgi:hypothetical protein